MLHRDVAHSRSTAYAGTHTAGIQTQANLTGQAGHQETQPGSSHRLEHKNLEAQRVAEPKVAEEQQARNPQVPTGEQAQAEQPWPEHDWAGDPLDYEAGGSEDSCTPDLHRAAEPQSQEPPPLPQLRPLVETGPEAEHIDGLMQEVLADLQKVGTQEARITGISEEDWLQKCTSMSLDPKQFTAGQPRAHMAGYCRFFGLPGPLMATGTFKRNSRRQARAVVKIIREGVQLQWAAVHSPCQQAHPFYRQKLEEGRRMLTRQVGRQRAETILRQPTPQQVHFPNHRSYREHADFAMQDAQQMLDRGVLIRWPAGSTPRVIAPLGVHVTSNKKRTVYDGRYINLWERYEPFRYETLMEVANWAQPGDYLWTTDFTAGYHHIPVAPEFWTYLGCRLPDGTICCFTHLPFGVSSGCRTFTQVIAEIYHVLRAAGISLTFLIDDEMGGARSREEALFIVWILVRAFRALGWTLSLHKCLLWPQQAAHFLGMQLLTACRLHAQGAEELVFRVPDKKAQELISIVQEALGKSQISPRLLARIAGKLLAMRPAVELAPLYTRGLYTGSCSTDGRQGWDELYDFQDAWRLDMAWILENLPLQNGRRVVKPEAAIHLVGDAGETGLAIFAPGGELTAPIVSTNTAAEMHLLQTAPAEFSSTFREVRALSYALHRISQQPGLARVFSHQRVVYWTDSQCTMVDVNKMGGNERIFPEVKSLWNQAAALDISLEVAWRSRWDPQQQLADSLEKQYDNSDWQLHDQTYQWLLSRQELQGRLPTLDVFASEHNTKVQGAFYSRWDCLGSSGVDAFRHPWAHRDGVRQFCYINGPFGSMGTILKKIREERCDALLIYPARHQYWRAMLCSLPIQMDVKLRAPAGQSLFLPSARVDPQKRKSAVQYIARAALIFWQQVSKFFLAIIAWVLEEREPQVYRREQKIMRP